MSHRTLECSCKCSSHPFHTCAFCTCASGLLKFCWIPYIHWPEIHLSCLKFISIAIHTSLAVLSSHAFPLSEILSFTLTPLKAIGFEPRSLRKQSHSRVCHLPSPAPLLCFWLISTFYPVMNSGAVFVLPPESLCTKFAPKSYAPHPVLSNFSEPPFDSQSQCSSYWCCI